MRSGRGGRLVDEGVLHREGRRAPRVETPIHGLRLKATRQLVATAAAREVDDRVEWLHPR